MQKIRVIFDGPFNYPSSYQFYKQGSSPKILEELIYFLRKNEKNTSEVSAALYLFNNPILSSELIRLSDKGVKVNIVSIPLEGYDNKNSQILIDLNQPNANHGAKETKATLAKNVYSKFIKTYSSISKLYIFPHIYVRSPRIRPFSRGEMPYSLHTKSFYIKYNNGQGAVALTSSNLAGRDLVKDEVLVIIEGDEKDCTSASNFFLDLIKNSILISDLDFQNSFTGYHIEMAKQSLNPKNFYIAPFYENSPNESEKILNEIISNAKKRLHICAQHICAYEYSYDSSYVAENSHSGIITSGGILSEVLKKGISENIEIKLLSQTFVDENGNSHGCRKPVNKSNFIKFIKEFKKNKIGEYAANKSVHSKYIIADNTVIISTCNFTPTQFIYLKHVNIPKFRNIPNFSYKGIFSEVGHYLIIENINICSEFISNFNEIWCRKDTFHFNADIETSPEDRICISCGALMTIRSGRYGQFWGCSNFPKCRHTEDI